MNELDLCLEVVSRSCQPLRYIRLWICWKPLETEAWFQRTTNKKWHMGYQMVTWLMTSHDPRRCCQAVRSPIPATDWLLVTVKSTSLCESTSLRHFAWISVFFIMKYVSWLEGVSLLLFKSQLNCQYNCTIRNSSSWFTLYITLPVYES